MLSERYRAHAQICTVSTVHNLSLLPFRQAHLTSASRPHPPRERSGGHLLCIHYTPPPASTNQEPEQGGRLGKHIVTDLYARLSTGGAERAGRRRSGGLYLSGHFNAGHPRVCVGRTPEQRPHTHTQTGMSVCKQDTLLTRGSPLKLIAQTQCVQVCVEKKVSQWGEEGRRGGRVERFLNEAA